MAHFRRSFRSSHRSSRHHRSHKSLGTRRSAFRTRKHHSHHRSSATPGTQTAHRVFQTGRIPFGILNGTNNTDIGMCAISTTFSSGIPAWAGNGTALLPWTEGNDSAGAIRLVQSNNTQRLRVMDGLPPCEAVKTMTPGSDDSSNFGIGAMALNQGNIGQYYSEGNMYGSIFKYFKFAAQVFRYNPIPIGYDATAPAGEGVTGIWETFVGACKVHVIDLGNYPDLLPSFSLGGNNSDKAILTAVRACRKKTFRLDRPWSLKIVPRVMRDQQLQENNPGLLAGSGPPAGAGLRTVHVGHRGKWTNIRTGALDATTAASLHTTLKPVHMYYGLLFVVEMPIIGSASLTTSSGWQDMLLENADLTFGELRILNYVHMKGVNTIFVSPENDPDGLEVTVGSAVDAVEKGDDLDDV